MMFTTIVACWSLLALIIFIILFFIPVPYGRYTHQKGRQLPDAMGWVLMEMPAVAVFGSMFLAGTSGRTITVIVFLILWMAHYIHRAFMYPFFRGDSKRGMPWWIVGLGFIFNCINGYLNGHYLFTVADGYTDQWMTDWRFLTGAGLFLIGYVINRDADRTLRRLRKAGEQYGLAHQGLFQLISCPNYFGEIILWLGWALATWSYTGLAFALWTAANLIPRARAHHRWYRKEFPDYPPERKALVPWLW